MTIHNADAVKWAKEYAGPLHHAMLCDPPYHLTSITKRFGKPGAAPAKEGTDGAFRRASAGFMGQAWDGGDVAFQPETWAAFAEVLYPGAFCMAFASSRGFHRMAVAIEDAGFILHPFIAWAFGSGFPKATRIDTQIDRDAGAERELVAIGSDGAKRKPRAMSPGGATRTAVQTLSEPATDAARAWSGHRYGLQALKPSVEPILVFQKPYTGRPVDCITQTGAGALNIAGGRIGTETRSVTRGNGSSDDIFGNGGERVRRQEYGGRWPANLIIGDAEAAVMIDRQSGQTTSGQNKQERGTGGIWDAGNGVPCGPQYGDKGGSSRFFFNVQTAIDEADPVLYRAKAGSAEREAGLDTWEARPSGVWDGRASQSETRNIGNTLPSAKRNIHPTLKPLSLCKYLAGLLLPPADYAPRRLFVPFSGVASEMIGADLAGWEEVNGVEQSAEYCRIGEARRRFWNCNAGLFAELCKQTEESEPEQGDLFSEAVPA